MKKEEQNQIALYLYNNIKCNLLNLKYAILNIIHSFSSLFPYILFCKFIIPNISLHPFTSYPKIVYIDNTLSSIPDTSFVLFGIARGVNVASLSLGTFIGISPYVVFKVLLPMFG